MKVYSKDLQSSVQEMRRVGTLVNKVRRLIELSQEGAPLTNEEKGKRRALQDEIEEICKTPLQQSYVDLGTQLDILAAQDSPALSLQCVLDQSKADITLGTV